MNNKRTLLLLVIILAFSSIFAVDSFTPLWSFTDNATEDNVFIRITSDNNNNYTLFQNFPNLQNFKIINFTLDGTVNTSVKITSQKTLEKFNLIDLKKLNDQYYLIGSYKPNSLSSNYLGIMTLDKDLNVLKTTYAQIRIGDVFSIKSTASDLIVFSNLSDNKGSTLSAIYFDKNLNLKKSIDVPFDGFYKINDITNAGSITYITGWKDGKEAKQDMFISAINFETFEQTQKIDWEKVFNLPGDQAGFKILPTNDNCLVVAGTTYSEKSIDIMTVKFSLKELNVIWQKYFDTGNRDEVYDMILGSNSNNIYITGTSRSKDLPEDIYILKINHQTGERMLFNVSNIDEIDVPNCVYPMTDKIMIAGYRVTKDSLYRKSFIFAIKNNN